MAGRSSGLRLTCSRAAPKHFFDAVYSNISVRKRNDSLVQGGAQPGGKLSPKTRRLDLENKMRTYARQGVQELWIIDPDSLELLVYQFSKDLSNPVRKLPADGMLTSPLLPGFHANLRAVYRVLRAQRGGKNTEGDSPQRVADFGRPASKGSSSCSSSCSCSNESFRNRKGLAPIVAMLCRRVVRFNPDQYRLRRGRISPGYAIRTRARGRLIGEASYFRKNLAGKQNLDR
jgi:hypothetical protein